MADPRPQTKGLGQAEMSAVQTQYLSCGECQQEDSLREEVRTQNVQGLQGVRPPDSDVSLKHHRISLECLGRRAKSIMLYLLKNAHLPRLFFSHFSTQKVHSLFHLQQLFPENRNGTNCEVIESNQLQGGENLAVFFWMLKQKSKEKLTDSWGVYAPCPVATVIPLECTAKLSSTTQEQGRVSASTCVSRHVGLFKYLPQDAALTTMGVATLDHGGGCVG